MSDGGMSHGPRTTDQLTTQLAQDNVIVDQVLGSGRTDEVDARLSGIADRVEQRTGVPVYVVVVQPPTDTVSEEPNKDLATVLPRRLGDGVYLIDTGTGVPQLAIRGTDIDAARFSQLRSETLDRITQETSGVLLPPAVQGETVLRLVGLDDPRTKLDGPVGEDGERNGILPDAQVASLRELAALTAEPERPESSTGHGFGLEPATTGDLALWGATSGALVLTVAYLTLRRAWTGRPGTGGLARSTPTGIAPRQRAQIEKQTRHTLDELARGLATAPAQPKDRDALERAVAAREVVEHLLPTADERELVGALTLSRIGLGDVHVATGRRQDPWRPCFVDPRHDEAREVSTFELEDAMLEVPTCEGCAKKLRLGRPLSPFRPASRGRARPYYEADDVWARTGYGALDPDVAHTVMSEQVGRR